MNTENISIIIPLRNAETTIIKTLESLLAQTQKFEELIIVNDASADQSFSLVKNFLEESNPVFVKNDVKVNLINHEKSIGLAGSYNDGIKNSKNELLVTMHADIILDPNSLAELVRPFFKKESDGIVATYHVSRLPREIWNNYNFWQKCFFSRKIDIKETGLDGKFDCFRKKAVEKVGYFDGKTYKNAGEDGDIWLKLKKIGEVVGTSAEIIHLHSADPNFRPRNIIIKEGQYSEARGILLRKGRIGSENSIAKMFFRELLVVSILIPYVNYLSLVLIVVYSFWYTAAVYIFEPRNPRILMLPFFNVYLLFVSFFYFWKGFIYGRQ